MTTDNETPTLYDDDAGGNASGDDPAIWVHPTDSSESIVIVTAKEGGLRAYDLAGTELQAIAASPAPRADGVDGRYNNVDIAHGLELDGTAFLFNPDREAVDEEHTAYGVAVHRPSPGTAYAVVTEENFPVLATAEIVSTADGFAYTAVEQLELPSTLTLPDGTEWFPCEEDGAYSRSSRASPWTSAPASCTRPRRTSACGGSRSRS